MSIEQEKMIVESLSSLYPLQEFEEKAIQTVLEALPHWIPVTEQEPKESGKYLVTAIISFIPDHVDDPDTVEAVTTANYLADIRGSIKWWGNNVEKVLAWMPTPERFKGVNV